mmetsp:Transcript_5389/g.19005  ORF Transcript_5389/g.19005 Transcript_5389/m.19005 type:complete len:117 (-) Transcript_5389:331-681(-)
MASSLSSTVVLFEPSFILPFPDDTSRQVPTSLRVESLPQSRSPFLQELDDVLASLLDRVHEEQGVQVRSATISQPLLHRCDCSITVSMPSHGRFETLHHYCSASLCSVCLQADEEQ